MFSVFKQLFKIMIKGLLRAKFSVTHSLPTSRRGARNPPSSLEEGFSGFGPLPKDEIMRSHLNMNEELASEARMSK